MKCCKKILVSVAVAGAVSFAGAASALSVMPFGSDANATAFLAFSSFGTFDFDWISTPYREYFDFSADAPFTVSLLTYDDKSNGAGNNSTQVSGFFLASLNGDGTLNTVFTDSTSNCANQFFTGTSGCDLVAESGSSRNDAVKPVAELFNLALGDYRIGLYDSATPVAGSASFGISAVPLPAAAWLFGTAVVGAGLVGARRRKQSNASA